MQINLKSINVLKFGGTSVRDLECMRRCVEKVQNFDGPTVVVVSAQAGKTDSLIAELAEYTKHGIAFNSIERDMFVTTGENLSAALFSGLLNSHGIKSVPLCGWQLPIVVQNSKITRIDTEILTHLLEQGFTVVLTGFQGVNECATIEALSRGGSDLTAVSISKFLGVDTCHIYTDVPGIYQICPTLRDPQQNKILPHINYEDAYDMAINGAKVIHADAVKEAELANVRIIVKSTFATDEDLGTQIHAAAPKNYGISVIKKDNAFFIHVLHNNLIPLTGLLEHAYAHTDRSLWLMVDDLRAFKNNSLSFF